jgi:tetratricopeptide (TPR) repeat protein
LNPSCVVFYEISAIILRTLKRYRAAIRSLDIALKITPNAPNLYCIKANCFQLLKENKNAWECYSIALELEPGFSDAEAGLIGLKKAGYYPGQQ